MKRIAEWSLSILIVSLALISVSLAQTSDVSLADSARETRKGKQAESAGKKVFDNDNLPKEEHISVVGGATSVSAATQASDTAASSDQSSSSQTPDTKDESKTQLAISPDQSAGDRELAYGEWRKKVADQKDTISLLQRELDVLQREYRLRAAAMYADVGNRLRNASQWDKEDRDYKDKVAAKQKDLDRAQQQLSDMREEARKSGVPAAIVE